MTYPQDTNTSTKPIISVILPVYNRESFLRKTIESVIAQSFQQYELIIIDDGSSDQSVNIINHYKQTYPQIISVITQGNKGVSSARNAGIAVANGTYLAFIDSDDLWIKSKLADQLKYMESKNIDICQTEEQWVRNGKKVNSMKKHAKHSGKIFFDCLPLCIVSPSAVMIKKKVLDEVGLFDEKLPAVEDYDLWLRISLKYPIYLMKKKLITKFGGHEDQLSRKYWGMDRFRVYSMLKILKGTQQTLNPFKKAALYWWIKEKSKVLYLGAFKRLRIHAYLKYKFLFLFYSKKWLNTCI